MSTSTLHLGIFYMPQIYDMGPTALLPLRRKAYIYIYVYIEIKIYVSNLSTTLVWNISHSKKYWARYDPKRYIGFHVKYLLLLSDFNENWIFSAYFRKILKYQISWKSVQWKPSSSMRGDRRAYGQTWRS